MEEIAAIDDAYAAAIQTAFDVLMSNLLDKNCSDAEEKFRCAIRLARLAKGVALQVINDLPTHPRESIP